MAGPGTLSVNQSPQTPSQRSMAYIARHPKARMRKNERQKEYQRRYNELHPGVAKARKRANKLAIREHFKLLKSYLECEECGATENLVFHHRDPETKSFNVGSCDRSWSTMLAEIEKCDVLCRTCHAFHHDLMGVM